MRSHALLALGAALATVNAVACVPPADPAHGARPVASGSPGRASQGSRAEDAWLAHLGTGAIVVSAVKGIEEHTLRRMSEVLAEELPPVDLAVLSGPSFAVELARSLPTAVVVEMPSNEAILLARHG